MEFTNRLGQPIGFPLPDWQPPPSPSAEPMVGRFCRLEILRPETHAADLFAANNQDATDNQWTYLAYGPFARLEAYRVWMEDAINGSDTQFWAVVDAATGRAVGVAAYLRIQSNVGSIEIGHLNFSPLLQRTPAATEAIFLLLQRAFAAGYRRVEWKCDALNVRSRRAARRFGFSFEGIFYQASVYKNRNRDTAWYAVIDPDWPRLQAAFQTWLAAANFGASGGQQRTRLSELTAPLLRLSGEEP